MSKNGKNDDVVAALNWLGKGEESKAAERVSWDLNFFLLSVAIIC